MSTLWARLRRSVDAASARFWLLPCRAVGRNVRLTGPVLIRGGGDIVLGDDVVLDARATAIELFVSHGARLELQAGVVLGPGVSIEALSAVTIEAGAVLGPFVKVLDNNFHATTNDRNERPTSTPIVIGAGARLEERVTVVPGGGVGAGTLVQADTVISRRVPAKVVVGGNPARLVRRLEA